VGVGPHAYLEKLTMLQQLKSGFLMMVVMTVITGFAYPAVVTAIARSCFTIKPTAA
jgi:K+-transporting ATPase c subunit